MIQDKVDIGRVIMSIQYRDVVRFQNALIGPWLQAAVVLTHCYATVLDPRPDLGVPARQSKLVYFWWW
jgi:hypothetical protein